MRSWRFTSSSLCGNPEAVAFSKSNYTRGEIDHFYDLFCPGNCRPQFQADDLYILLSYLKDGSLSCLTEKPYDPKRDVSGIKVKQRSSSESEHHLYLKQLATAWLMDEKSIKEVAYEAGFQGGECDVMSSDGIWIIECGATRPCKVYEQIFGSGKTDGDSKVVVFNDLAVATFSAGPMFHQAKKEDTKARDRIARKVFKKIRWF